MMKTDKLLTMKPRTINSMSNEQIDSLLRQATKTLNQRIKRFNAAGISPASASPHFTSSMNDGIQIAGKSRAQKIKLLQAEQRLLRDPNSTLRGYRQTLTQAARAYEKTHPTATKVAARGITAQTIKAAHGRTKIVYDQNGNPVEVAYGTPGLTKKELAKYWKTFHEARDRAGIFAGSQGSQDLLEEFHSIYVETKDKKKVIDIASESYRKVYEEREARDRKEREFINEKEPTKIF